MDDFYTVQRERYAIRAGLRAPIGSDDGDGPDAIGTDESPHAAIARGVPAARVAEFFGIDNPAALTPRPY